MKSPAYALAVLFLINTMNFFDRVIGGALGEPIRREWGLSDSALGALGTAFTLLYAFVGVPLGRLADRKPRKSILAAAVFVWSALTAVSGLTRTYWQLFATRLGVGVGEAACAPAATSLIGDLFPPAKRARAMSIFMMGLPIGIALSYFVGSSVAHAYGWRTAFFVAGIPGVLAAIAALFITEPPRGSNDAAPPRGTKDAAPAQPETGSPWRVLLRIPTLWWLILSGALHNFNMYALGSFLAPLLMRYHAADLREAGTMTTLVYGLSGIPGLLLGGALADKWSTKRKDGRLLVAAIATAVAAPLMWAALARPAKDTTMFVILGAAACAFMYVYYASVYATLQDVVAPSMRGAAMALYFFAMYVLGASFGPLATGMLSDHFTRRAAAGAASLEPFRGAGLHAAMYAVPVLCILLALVLFAATRTVGRDMERLSAAR